MAVAYSQAQDETYGEEPSERRGRRRGRRALIVITIMLIVLAGLLVVGDRAAVGFAERAIAERVSQELTRQDAQSAPPEVTVAGVPFLTQVVAGEYEKITILLRDVRGSVNGSSLTLPRLDVVARDVRASIDTLRTGQGEVVARTVDGTATVTYESVAELVERRGLQLAEEDGKLVGSAPLEILGREFIVRGAATLSVDDQGRIKVDFEELTAEGLPNIPGVQQLITAYAEQISFTAPLPDLPFQLVVQEVRVLPEGLVVTASAQEVPLN